MVREIRNTADGSRAVAVAGRVVSAKSADSPSRVPGPATISRFAALGLQRERAFLDRIGAIGGVAGGEQHLTRFEPVALRADGQDPQAGGPSRRRIGIRSRNAISSSIVIAAAIYGTSL